jgi:hypothetical protein
VQFTYENASVRDARCAQRSSPGYEAHASGEMSMCVKCYAHATDEHLFGGAAATSPRTE